ncbi:carbon-nitrogen hydrolase [Sarocladium strictum]
MTGTIRLGTASPASQSTTAEALSHISSIAARAATSHIDILLLPEAYIGGYPRGTAFGCVIGDRSAEGREEFAKYFEQSVDLGDTVGNGAGAGDNWVKRQIGTQDEVRGDGTREELERIARDSGVFIVVGCIERAGGSLYCSVVYVCPKEGMIGKRRKVMPTGTERLIWAQGSPATLKAVSTIIRGTRVNLAAAICWENYMPLLRQTLYAQNINLYLAPTADGRDAWMGLMRTVGVEGRCFVVSSNMCIPAEKLPKNGTDTNVGETNGTRTRFRRNSIFTGEGHEIALPNGSGDSKKKRRKSVIDENGNEIVLCCDDDDNYTPAREESQQTQSQTNGATGAKTQHKQSASSFVSRGGSSIVNPFGDVLAGPQWEDEHGLIFADVDFRDCIKGRLDLDAGGSYSRNDSFNFSVQGLDLDPLPY